MARRVRFSFSPSLIGEPIIYRLGREFDVITNIRRANLTRDEGWVILDIEGDNEDVDHALQWAGERGVQVDPLEGDDAD